MSNSQPSVSRRAKVSSQESKTLRDGVRKSVAKTRESAKTKVLVDDAKKELGKSSTPARRPSGKPVVTKQDSIGSPRTLSRPRVPVDRPIIDQSIKLASSKLKVSSNAAARPKLTKQSSSEERRGVSTIYMPKKSSSTSKEQSRTSRKEETKPVVKNSSNTNGNRKRLSSTERRRSRTLSPSEIQVLKRAKDSKSSAKTPTKNDSVEADNYEYEDDFEDYESDFQECTDTEASEVSDESEESVSIAKEPVQLQAQKPSGTVDSTPARKVIEEEHMLDSGHYELQEARRRAARIDLMSANRSARIPVQAIDRPGLYADEKPEIKSLPSSADEGFEDGRSGDFAKSPPIPPSFEQVSIQDDRSLKKRSQANSRPRLTRGRQLLQMIKLDAVEWSLFECTPIPYDEFILIHGKMNTRQISTQTNEDSLAVEVQTDDIDLKNMWTQFPVNCRSVLRTNDDLIQFTKDLRGVGGDEDAVNARPQYDILRLNEFLNAAGKVMLSLLEMKESHLINFKSEGDAQRMPFSEATIKLSVANVAFLAGRPVSMIRYSDVSSKVLLTIHDPADEEVQIASSDDVQITDCCTGCQWDICEPSRPMKLFYSSSNITACCFHPTNYNVVFAGLEDGSVSLWDLREDKSYHRRVVDKDNEVEWTMRSATFTSGCSLDEPPQTSRIVALSVLSKLEVDPTENGQFMPIQICSLDEDESCVVWSVLRNFDGKIGQDLGQSWWGKLRLVKSHEICLNLGRRFNKNGLLNGFRDIRVDSVDPNSLYVATTTNQVLHAKQIGRNSKPSLFKGDCTGSVTCIENCPFDQPYFLIGCEDGSLRLHSSTIEKPLLQLRNSTSAAPIKVIQWSRSKPFIIFVLDEDSNLHIWDLSKSAVSPISSISPEKYAHVGSMQLSPCRSGRDLTNQYITLGSDNGNVEVHKFSQPFHHSRREDVHNELQSFLDYLSIY